MIVGLELVVSYSGVFISQRRTQGSSRQQTQLAALQQLRDSGVITAQEYESKVQAFQAISPAPSAALKEKLAALRGLRDTAVKFRKTLQPNAAWQNRLAADQMAASSKRHGG